MVDALGLVTGLMDTGGTDSSFFFSFFSSSEEEQSNLGELRAVLVASGTFKAFVGSSWRVEEPVGAEDAQPSDLGGVKPETLMASTKLPPYPSM